jgi:hypothetical protein
MAAEYPGYATADVRKQSYLVKLSYFYRDMVMDSQLIHLQVDILLL